MKIRSLWRWFACDVMAWHTLATYSDTVAIGGFNVYAKCRRCGYVGLVDSQGNIF